MGKSRCWEVWWAAVKFEENDTKKERPIVFLRDHVVATVAPATTMGPRPGIWGEYPIKYWKEAGLEKETTVRLSKIFRLEARDLIRKIGRLNNYDIMKIQMMMDTEWLK
jgi:hypothetical protein|nr:MAG TPA: endoribonuclease [Caudoviricetes sp.]DAS99371.1 MAG TPA: endoribonuclease [Caudoviricetes sp.]